MNDNDVLNIIYSIKGIADRLNDKAFYYNLIDCDEYKCNKFEIDKFNQVYDVLKK